MMFKRCEIVGSILFSIGATLFGVSYGTAFWRYLGDSKAVSTGMWQQCLGLSTCDFIGWWSTEEAYWHIYIARYILAVPAFLIIICFLLLIISLGCSKHMFKAVGIFVCISAVFTLAGDGIFVGLCYRYDNISIVNCTNLSYSFYLNASAAAFFILACIGLLQSKHIVHPSDEWEY